MTKRCMTGQKRTAPSHDVDATLINDATRVTTVMSEIPMQPRDLEGHV